MWRGALHWYGGMGIIVLVVAILPMLGVGGMQLYKAETPGPVKNEKLTPRITQTAKALWFIYFLITVACVLALKIAGMDWFDAVFTRSRLSRSAASRRTTPASPTTTRCR